MASEYSQYNSDMELVVNGARRRVQSDPERPLLYVLREELDLTGTKYGCGEGQCRACTVLLDGTPVRSCITPVSKAQGKQVTTIEGLEQNGKLHPVQEAFIKADAMQCGYCTPGMIVGSVALLKRIPDPNEAQIARELDGHICRCGTYPRIVTAVRMAARMTNGGQHA
jgi:aerobic-type carbon monoxide dehydrogenase small subunit (CoxS/CutS family)